MMAQHLKGGAKGNTCARAGQKQTRIALILYKCGHVREEEKDCVLAQMLG